MAIQGRSLIERLMDNISPEPNSGCWLWMAQLSDKGYGAIKVNGRPRRAHRICYEEIVGPIPDGLHLDHLCRVRCCVNPRHLEPVTLQENLARGLDNSRSRETYRTNMAARTHCLRGHEYNSKNTTAYNGKRQCRVCANSLRRNNSLHGKEAPWSSNPEVIRLAFKVKA